MAFKKQFIMGCDRFGCCTQFHATARSPKEASEIAAAEGWTFNTQWSDDKPHKWNHFCPQHKPAPQGDF